MTNTRLANATFVRAYRPLTDLIVAPAPLDGPLTPNYVSQLASLATWQALRDVPSPAAPVPLLFLLLRHAALRQYLDTALDLLTPTGTAQPVERLEPEVVGLSVGIPRPTPWDLLQRTLPAQTVPGQTQAVAVGTFLDGARQNANLPAGFADF